MCRQPLSTFYFFCFNILCAQSENTTIAPAMIAVSLLLVCLPRSAVGIRALRFLSLAPILQVLLLGKKVFRLS